MDRKQVAQRATIAHLRTSKSSADDDPQGVANLDPRGMIGRIYVEYHLTLLHTKYTSFRPCGFREEDF